MSDKRLFLVQVRPELVIASSNCVENVEILWRNCGDFVNFSEKRVPVCPQLLGKNWDYPRKNWDFGFFEKIGFLRGADFSQFFWDFRG